MSKVQTPPVLVPTTRQFVGIDLAGDSGTTGVAVITVGDTGPSYSFPLGSWKGTNGLLRLRDWVLCSQVTALDQPFSYAAETQRLLADMPTARGNADASAYCSRRTDTAMRAILDTAGLAADYVMSPIRCQNIWRALALARLCGLSRREVCLCSARLVETHPRVAWTVTLGAWTKAVEARRLIETYKGESRSETQRSDARKAILAIFEAQTGIGPGGKGADTSLRAEACESEDKFEALICAYVAYLRPRGETILAGFTNPASEQDLLTMEGAAVIPSQARNEFSFRST